MMHYVSDPQPEVRQAIVYGFGIMAQFGGEGYAAACINALPLMGKLIAMPDSREPENISPTENAISAVTKILKWNPGGRINIDEYLPTW